MSDCSEQVFATSAAVVEEDSIKYNNSIVLFATWCEVDGVAEVRCLFVRDGRCEEILTSRRHGEGGGQHSTGPLRPSYWWCRTETAEGTVDALVEEIDDCFSAIVRIYRPPTRTGRIGGRADWPVDNSDDAGIALSRPSCASQHGRDCGRVRRLIFAGTRGNFGRVGRSPNDDDDNYDDADLPSLAVASCNRELLWCPSIASFHHYLSHGMGAPFVSLLFLFIAATFLQYNAVQAQQIALSQTSKVNVVPQCGKKFMTVQLHFDGSLLPAGRFVDWIVVGTTNRPECRLQGNGELQYVIEIAVMNDPCGTQMSAPGTLENVIRIGQNPLVILGGDETLTVRCVYGLPEVGTNLIPSITPSFNIQTRPQGPPTRPLRIENDYAEPAGTPVRTIVNVGYVYIIIFAILLLALVCLFIGCLYACFKRQKVRNERRKRLLVAVPPSSELSKLGLGHLWWSGKTAVANDALLNHDYMVSSNSTREGLSVSTDVGSATTSSAGSPGHSGPEQGALSAPSTDTTDHHRESSSSSSHHSAKTEPKSYSEWRQQMIASKDKQPHPPAHAEIATVSALYAHVNKRQQQEQATSAIDLDRVTLSRNARGAPSQLRSITEIYQSTDQQPKSDGDNESVSTLEGKHYPTEDQSHSIVATADVHAMAVRDAVDRDWIDALAKCVDQHRGFGPRKLTEQEIGRWRHMVTNDTDLQKSLFKARTLEDFDEIARRPQYRTAFPVEKWSLIVQSLANAAFVRRLDKMIDRRAANEQGPIAEVDPMVQRRFAKRDDGPRKVASDDLAQRLFTRDSYYRVKESVEPGKTPRDDTAERSTTEIIEAAPAIVHGHGSQRSQRTRSQSPRTTQPLNVYVGDVHIPHQPPQASGNPTSSTNVGSAQAYSVSYDNWQTHANEL
uniref:Uncharacterized protein n=1 Tax=Plectus sambesii TaxID=2011161 RepID=A0A914VJM0_9BILA